MRKGESTRSVIVENALGLAKVVGLHGVTIGELAKETGLSKSGLFAHFRSKENLQLQILEEARDQFIDIVVIPAVERARGEARVFALFDNWMTYARSGCIFASSTFELAERAGPLKSFLATSQEQWMGTLARAARIAVDEGHFRADLDCEQFAFEAQAVMLGSLHSGRLLRDRQATERSYKAFEHLMERARQ